MKSFKDRRLYRAYREIVNYFFIKRTIKKQKSTPVWQSFNLRADWVGRVYTVLNLRKEDIGDPEEVKRARLLELMIPINKYMRKLDLHEIVFPAIEKKSDRSYLIVYSPLFEHFTILYFIRICIILGGIITFFAKYESIINTILGWLS